MVHARRSLALTLLLALPLPAARAGGLDGPEPAPDRGRQELSADELVRRGRERLAAGEPDAALPLLEKADERTGGAAATRVWLIRCWIARGYVNDALDGADDLAARGEKGAAVDYLYGLALHARAKEYIAQQVGGGMIEMNFRDAVDFLDRATRQDPAEYGDAFLPLAEAAWHAQDLTTARAAAEKAVELRPDGFSESYMLGRVAFSQFVAASGDEARGTEADAHWQIAYDAFARAADNAGEPEDPELRKLLAQDHLQAAFALVWKERNEEASEHFSDAIAWDPAAVDYRGLWTYLEPLGVLRCIERGVLRFRAVHGPEATEDALALWWLGWANLDREFHEEAEQAFSRALAKEPAYGDCRFYIGLSRYLRQDYSGAIESICEGFQETPEAVSGAAASDPAKHRPILGFLLDRCASAQPPKNLEAALLAELQTAIAPEDPLLWSYVGLFYRDAGDGLRGSQQEGAAERRSAYYERAYDGYSRALELAPGDPNYLNDTAVVLHYCLRRDLDRARELYERAAARAEEELARTDLPADRRELYTTALRDARNNLARLGRER